MKNYRIEKLSSSNAKLENIEDTSYIETFFQYINFLDKDYPNFRSWYFDKVVPGIRTKEREILVCFVENDDCCDFGGIAILKNAENEKKICTLRVAPEYKGNGVGYALFEKSFELLETKKPLFTVSSEKVDMFLKHINKYNFHQTEILENYYLDGKSEYVFNGNL